MARKLIFCAVPYLLSDVPLASFVPDPRYPNIEAKSVIKAKADIDYTVREQEDFQGPAGFQIYTLISRSSHAPSTLVP